MTEIAYRGGLADDDLATPAGASPLELWKTRLKQGTRDRLRYEKDWKVAQAFLQGKQWIGWDPHERRVVKLKNPQNRIRYTVNKLPPYKERFQGKLAADEIIPTVEFRNEDQVSQAFANQSSEALKFSWEEEIQMQELYLEASSKRLTYGLSAIMLRFDSQYGKQLGMAPMRNGMPILDPAERQQAEQGYARGEPVEWRMLHEGRLAADVLSPFNIWVPPGVEHERNFPWVIIGRPVLLEDVKAIYGQKAANLTAEKLQTVDAEGLVSSEGSRGGHAELHDHVMLYCGYRMPGPASPKGAEFTWARDTELRSLDELPLTVNGQGKAGIAFFKFRVVEGQFWPVGMVTPAVGPQRQINHSRSQNQEVKDRIGMPRIFATEGSITEVNRPQGFIAEVINVRPGFELPKEMQGTGPGPWISQESEMAKADMDDVIGMRADASKGPTGATAYALFAFFNEQEDQAVGPIRRLDRIQLAMLAKLTLSGARKFWLPDKQIAVAGEQEGMRDVFLYNAAELPDEFYCSVATSAPVPQSQAAKLQAATDIFDRAVSSGQTLPIDWLAESFEKGGPQPLPKREMQVQQDVAKLENHLMQSIGQPVPVMPHHNDELHVKEHRQAQAGLEGIPGQEQLIQVIEAHIQMHLMSAQAKAAQAAPTNNGQQRESGPQAGAAPTNPGGFGPQGAAAAAGAQQQ